MTKSQNKVLLLYILAYNARFETGDYYSDISHKVFRYKRKLICDSNYCDTCEYLYRGPDEERRYPRCKLSQMVNFIIKQ